MIYRYKPKHITANSAKYSRRFLFLFIQPGDDEKCKTTNTLIHSVLLIVTLFPFIAQWQLMTCARYSVNRRDYYFRLRFITLYICVLTRLILFANS